MSMHSGPSVTTDEYLAIERAAEFRSEFVGGETLPMQGGTMVVSNALFQLMSQLPGGRCRAVANDLRLFSQAHRVFTYPDIVVTCGPPVFLDPRRDTIVDATAIIEVLSPSTKSYDRGEKFAFYRSLPAFAEYLLLGRDEVRAEHHARQAMAPGCCGNSLRAETRLNWFPLGAR